MFWLWAFAFSLIASTVRAALLGGTVEIAGPNCRFPDVAYGSVSRQFLIVWTDYSVTNGARIFGQFLRGDGSFSGGMTGISDSGFGALFPAIAFNASSNEFLVTWDDAGGRGAVIYGQRVRGSDGLLVGGNFPIGSLYGGIRSAVAWSPASACYLVVYWGPGPANSPPEVYGQRVSGGALLGAAFNISNDGVFSGYPAVAWAEAVNQFLVTWDNEDGSIHGQRVNAANGALLGGAIFVTSVGARDRSCIAYDSINARWLVQFNDGGNAGFSYDQYAQFINPDGSLSGGALPLAHTPGFEGDTQFGGDIAFEPGAHRFFSSFGTDTGMGGQESLESGATLGSQVVLGTGYYTSLNNAADSDTHRFLTAWEGILNGSFKVLAQLYATTLGPPSMFAATASNASTFLSWKNPIDSHLVGITIRVKTSGYPSSPTDGTLVTERIGSPGALDSFTHTNLTNWTTYYYAAFAHDNGTNYSPAAQANATPRPTAVIVNTSDFNNGTDGWILDVWRSGSLGFGGIAWDSSSGNIVSTGAGATNTRDACAREGSIMMRLLSTVGYSNIQLEYDVMAALFAPPTGSPAGNCAVLEGTQEDKLVVYYSTSGTNGPWQVAQTLTEGVELPAGWAHQFVNFAGLSGVSNNPNFALKFQWQFNTGSDTGRVDNVRLLSSAIAGQMPAIAVAPSSVERTLPIGTLLPDDVFKVSNAGGGVLDFSVTNDASWLSLTPTNGTSAGPEQQVSISYSTASLAADDYHATIEVKSTNASNSQQAIPITLHVIPSTCLWEPFNYYDGDLTTMGAANWSGTAGNQMEIAEGTLNVAGGSGAVEARRTISCSGSNNLIVAEIKIRGGSGTGDFFWNIYLDDEAGNNFARWYGGSRIARGRVGGTATPDMTLSGANVWDDLYVEIDTAANTSEFFFNGISFGTIQHGTTPGSTLGEILIERIDRPTASADLISFDDLTVGQLTQPRLNFTFLGNQLTLSWPATGRGAKLESTGSMTPTIAWNTLTNGVVITNGQFVYTTITDSTNRFYRLKRL